MNTQFERFVSVLFPDVLEADDLDIVAQSTKSQLDEVGQMGQARLNQARIGLANPGQPNSLPLFSRTGAKLGYVAEAEFAEGLADGCFWLVE